MIIHFVTINLFCNVIQDNLPLVNDYYYHPFLFVIIPELYVKQQKFETNHKAYNYRKVNFPTLFNAFLQTDQNYRNDISNINLAVNKRDFKNYLMTMFPDFNFFRTNTLLVYK